MFALLLFNCDAIKDSVNYNLFHADQYFKAKDYNDAIDLYTKVINITEENDIKKYFCYYKRACSNFYLDNNELALADLQLAIQIKSKSEKANEIIGNSLRLKGGIYSSINKKTEAIRFYKQALKFSQDPHLYSDLGYALAKIGESGEAIQFLEKSLEFDSNGAYTLNNLGLAYLIHGDLEKSIHNLNLSEKLDSNNSFLYKHKGLYLIKKGELELACENFNKSQDLGYREKANKSEKEEVINLIKKHCMNNKVSN